MRFISAAALAASAALLTATTGSPVPPATVEKRSFTLPPSLLRIAVLGGSTVRVNQVPNRNFIQGRRGPVALANAYRKFGLAVPKELLDVIDAIVAQILANLRQGRIGGGGRMSPGMVGGGRMPINQTAVGNTPVPAAGATQGDVDAIPSMLDIQYLCPVQIGTPPQTLNLNFDTGSSDLWVFSSETPRQQVNGQTIYDIEASSTAEFVPGAQWRIMYGDGSGASGAVYMDTVTVGEVTVARQAVESARQVSPSFSRNMDSDGLLGLAFSSINTVKPQQQKTFFDNAMEQLAMPLFTANLKRTEAGNYNFGFVDTTEFEGDITFVDSNTTRGFWEFDVDSITVGGQPVTSLAAGGAHRAMADTGTTLLLLPPEVVRAYYAAVPSARNSTQAGGFIFNCAEQLPDYVAVIGGYEARVPGEFINFAPADTDDPATATICFGGIQAVQATLPFAIYGDVFLKTQFVVFHGGNRQLGFAAKPL